MVHVRAVAQFGGNRGHVTVAVVMSRSTRQYRGDAAVSRCTAVKKMVSAKGGTCHDGSRRRSCFAFWTVTVHGNILRTTCLEDSRIIM